MKALQRYVGGGSSGLFCLASLLGALSVAACSQAPAFTTQTETATRSDRLEGESDATAVAVRPSACSTEAVAHPECRAGVPGVEGQTGGGDTVLDKEGAPGSEYGGSTSPAGDAAVPGYENPGSAGTGDAAVPGYENPGSAGTGDAAVPAGGDSSTGTDDKIANNGGGTLATPVPTPVVTPLPPTPVPGPIAGDWREQSISEPDQGKVDILWVIDNSGSMEWAQRELAAKFENFARELTSFAIDFRIGVTTTNVCRSDGKVDEFCPDTGLVAGGSGLRGGLVKSNGELYLTPNSSSFTTRFSQLAMRGTAGSGLEQGLSAAKFAVEKSAAGKENAGFLRNDANLAVIVLSDEEDDGIQIWEEDAWGNKGNKDYWGNPSYAIDPTWKTKFNFANQRMTADGFVSQLDTLKGQGKFQVSAITGIRGTDGNTFCYKDSAGKAFGPMEAGTNYIKAASLTGGVAENICGNWQSILSNIGRSTVELTTRIMLTAEPFPGTLEVYVNGQKWASGWEYDAQAKNVVFKSVPPYGAQVVVRYREIIR